MTRWCPTCARRCSVRERPWLILLLAAWCTCCGSLVGLRSAGIDERKLFAKQKGGAAAQAKKRGDIDHARAVLLRTKREAMCECGDCNACRSRERMRKLRQRLESAV